MEQYYDVHIWVPEKRKSVKRWTGIMFEMLVRAPDVERAREKAIHHHPGGDIRKCQLAIYDIGSVIHIRDWKTQD